MLIKAYSDDFELVVVEIKINNKEIRIISGYGPQETWNEADRLPFFLALEEEIIKAGLQGRVSCFAHTSPNNYATLGAHSVCYNMKFD